MTFSNIYILVIITVFCHQIIIGAKFGGQDCCALQMEGKSESGVYQIFPYENDTKIGVRVYCDFKTNGGGWTVIQRREEVTGPIERFYRSWDSYVQGFGSREYSHWIGLDNMAAITSGMDQELRIDLRDWRDKKTYAAYREFQVEASKLYRLHVRFNYNGTAGDNFSAYSHGVGFTTKDRDHDYDTRNCAVLRNSAWWYINCDGPNLNGIYVSKGVKYNDGVSWNQLKGHRNLLKFVEMKVRNRNFPSGCIDKHRGDDDEEDVDDNKNNDDDDE